MSDAVVLTLRAPLDGQLDLSGVTFIDISSGGGPNSAPMSSRDSSVVI